MPKGPQGWKRTADVIGNSVKVMRIATDPEEMQRVRDSFLKKKLALTETDAHLDEAVKAVTDKMKAVRDKSRVTVYYLLAEKFGKLAMFHPKK